jgi:PAS domain S-box-containing protein
MRIGKDWIKPITDKQVWIFPTAASLLLIVLGQYSRLGFHTLAELTTIIISFVVFALGWSTYSFSKNTFLIFLACGYFWVGSLDLMHTFTFPGMNVFVEGNFNLGLQFWIAGRYFEALLFLAVPFAISRKQNPYILFLAFGVVSITLTTFILRGQFPTFIIEGQGLTAFKVYSEYIIDFILAIAMVNIFLHRQKLAIEEIVLVTSAIVLTMFAELLFTFYSGRGSFYVVAGHILKVYSFWFIYQAIVTTNLRRPYMKIEKTEKLFKDTFEQAAVGIAHVAPDGRWLRVNQRLSDIVGYTRHEMLSLNFQDITYPEDLDADLKHVAQLLSGEIDSYSMEKRYCHKDGSIVWINLTVSLVRDASGRPKYFISVIEDIAERKRAEKALRESEIQVQFQAEMLENAPVIAAFHDLELNVVWANKAYEDATGSSIQVMAGRKCYSVWGLAKACRHCPVVKALETGETAKAELTPQNQDHWPESQGYWVSRAAPVHDEDGRMMGAIEIAIDITDLKNAEKEREQLRGQLIQSQKMESIGTLAGGIAHDFNNILGIILGNAELAMDDVPEWNPARNNLDEVRKACLRAKDVIRQILAFSRKSEIEQKSTNIASVVVESLKLSRASIPTSIEIRQNIANDVDDILGDPTQMHQIMINLCTNAAHAMENDGGILDVTLENTEIDEDTASEYPELNPGPHVHLGVSDTGDGINAEVIDRVFDPYFTTKEVGKGTGMGLAVVHGIVKSHHGSISVESELGKGTTFKILFPAVKEKVGDEPKDAQELPTGKERILFVDDEESMVNLNQQRLERLGYKVTPQTDSSEALKLFLYDPNQFDLVITDMTMPRMTGDKLTQEILKIRADMPIILCTGYSERMSSERAQELGIRKYIEKPIEMETLARSVREVLDGK